MEQQVNIVGLLNIVEIAHRIFIDQCKTRGIDPPIEYIKLNIIEQYKKYEMASILLDIIKDNPDANTNSIYFLYLSQLLEKSYRTNTQLSAIEATEVAIYIELIKKNYDFNR